MATNLSVFFFFFFAKFSTEVIYKKFSNNLSFVTAGPTKVARDVSLVFSTVLSDHTKFGTGVVYINFLA